MITNNITNLFIIISVCIIFGSLDGVLPLREHDNYTATCIDKQIIQCDNGLTEYTVTFELDNGKILKSDSSILGMENTYIIYNQSELNKRYLVEYERKTYTAVNSGGLYCIDNVTLINN
jgi:hypothetical protein